MAPKVVTLHKSDVPYVSNNLKGESAFMEKLNHPSTVSLQVEEVVFVVYFF